MQDNLAPLIQEHIDRYSGYSTFYSVDKLNDNVEVLSDDGRLEIAINYLQVDKWNDNVQMLRVFAQNRPDALRGHIIDYFNLEGITEITLGTNYSEGTVVINTIDTSLYVSDADVKVTWTGQYFIGIPVTITAVPKDGYRFDRWLEIKDDSPVIILNPTGQVTLTAQFSPN